MRHRWLRVWVALALIAGACGVGAQGSRTPRGSVDSTGRARTPRDLAGLALAGTSDGDEAHLTARRALRPVRVPNVGRGANARFDFDNGKRGWVTAMPSEELLVSPAFANGKIYVGGGFASHQFFALDAYDGELRWAVAAPDGGPTAAIVHKARVIFNTESCTLFVVDAETGELRWKRWLGDPLMSQPAATDEMVLSAYPANGAHMFGAFRLSDGEPIWTTPIPADVIQAPQVAGGSVWFATMDGSAFRVNLRDGRVRWQAQTGAASPLFVDGDRVLTTRRVDEGSVTFEQPVVLSARNGEVVREAERIPAPYLRGGTRERELFHAQAGAWGNVPHGDHLGLTNVAAGWAFQGSSAAVLDGRAYFAVAGEIRAREIATGRDVWRRRYSEAADSQAVSPPAVVGAQMIFGTLDGHLYATDIDTGMTLWAYDVGEPIVFQPIVAQGWVYVATARGNVIGLEIGDPGLDGWHMWGGNAEHTGLVETAGEIDPALVASRERPSRGTMRLAAFTPQENAESAEAPEQASDADGVLRIERREQPELPLTATRVDGTISGFVARMVVTQTFENPYDRPIEAVYLFPLPDAAAVDAMEMHIGDRVVRGRIQERRRARATYEAARTEGRRAALLEASRPTLFTQRVANIQPGERIEVRIAYAQHLPYEDGTYEVMFPMSAPRRFDPANPSGHTRDELATRDSVAAASARTSERAPTEIRLDIDAALPISRIASPSHRVSIERSGETRARVVLARTDGSVDRDFVLRYGTAGETPRAAVIAHREEEGGYVTLVIEPPTVENAEAAPRDVVFVVDTSSSMRGRPMDQAKAVMRSSLRSLRGSDTFQILAFSDELQRSSPAPAIANEEAIADGIAFVDRIRAVGATQMVPAIESALDEAMSPEAGRVRLVVLVTDGYVANERQVLQSIASKLDGERIYALGVGSSPNRFLLDRATEIGRGRSMYVGLSEDPAATAAKFVALVDKPVLTDIAIDWDGLDVADVYPRFTPDLFAGRPLVLHARYGRGGRANVRVSGMFAGERLEQTLSVALPAQPNGTANDSQRVLWARAAVADRLNRMTLREDPGLVREVTELGLRHAIVTPYTSFVAVDVEENPSQAQEAAPTPTLSPARSLPGDPEIRIPAPRDARAVTIILPFGETLSAAWEPELRMWSARFLVPRDAEEGTYPIYVLVTHADGREERLMLWYTVDQAAPVVRVTTEGELRPGATIVLTATQVLTNADLAQVNESQSTLTDARAQILMDARRVEVSTPWGEVVPLEIAGPGTWRGELAIPADASGVLELRVVTVDLAANVRVAPLRLTVAR